MKFNVITLFCLVLLSPKHGYANPETETCTPNFKEIFDFSIGDTYQYRETYPYPDSSSVDDVIITTRYTIESKEIDGDEIRYAVSGIIKTVYTCYLTDPLCSVWFNIRAFEDVILYTDSASHFLNSCHNDLIPIGQFTGEELYSYVSTDEIDSRLYKCIGGTNNIFEYNGLNELEKVFTLQLEMDFAAHLGLVKSKLIEFEYTHEIILEGYIIDGDTSGVIMDNVVENPTSFALQKENTVQLYPNPSNGELRILTSDKFDFPLQIDILNSMGQLVLQTQLNDTFLDLTAFDKGVYFVRISHLNEVETEKIILY